jgi:hypothetical protein
MDRESTIPVGTEETSPQAQPQGSEPLKKNQCALCRQEGHWKNECPQLQARHKITKEKEDFTGLASIEQAED